MTLRRRWLALGIVLLAGCGPSGFGPPDRVEADLTAQQGPVTPPKPQPPPLPPPPAGSWPAPTRPAAVTQKVWTPSQPALPEAVAKVTVDPNASLDDLARQFDEVRARKQILPTGEVELELLYDAAIRAPFQGKGNLQDRFEFMKEWAKQKPEDATPLIMLAKLHVIWGWEARGSGYAGTVTQDGFRLFDERLQTALNYALKAEKLAPQDPELYRVLVDLAKGLSAKRQHIDRWVETARKIQPNYFPVYEATAEYLLPRWHGDPGDIEEFIDKVSAAIGGDDGLEAYARVAMVTNMYDSTMLYTSEYDKRKIAQGAAVMEQRYPQAQSLLNFLAVVAWKEDNQPLARKYLERLQKVKVDHRQFGSDSRYQAFVAYCATPAPTQKPDDLFRPYFHPPRDLIYLDGGKRFLTTPYAEHELVKFWDRADLNRPAGALPEFPDQIAGLAADAAGKRIILSAMANNQSTDLVFNMEQLEEPVIYRAAGQRLGTALSPDGKTAATCRQKTVYLWDPATGQQLHALAGQFDQPKMRFSPDSKQLLIVNRSETQVYDVQDGMLVRIHQRTVPQEGTYGASLSRADLFLDAKTVLGIGTVRPRGVPALVKWTPHDDAVVELMRLDPGFQLTIDDLGPNYAVLSDNRGGLQCTIYIVRRSDGKVVRTIHDGHATLVTQKVLSPNESELATIEYQGPIRFWKIPK